MQDRLSSVLLPLIDPVSVNGQSRYACLLCRKVFTHRYTCRRHISMIHSDLSEQTTHFCSCGRRFKWKSALARHMKHCTQAIKDASTPSSASSSTSAQLVTTSSRTYSAPSTSLAISSSSSSRQLPAFPSPRLAVGGFTPPRLTLSELTPHRLTAPPLASVHLPPVSLHHPPASMVAAAHHSSVVGPSAVVGSHHQPSSTAAIDAVAAAAAEFIAGFSHLPS